MSGRINGFSLAYAAVGGVVMWSGITGSSISTTFRGITSGQAPTSNQEPISTAVATPTSSATSAAGNTGASSASAAANQAIAKLLAAPYLWSTGTQWADLVSLWNQESGWNASAQNPGSTAYGIAQFLDTTWAPYGAKTSDATLQIRYGLEYIKDRYGSPAAAWLHEQQNGWY